MTRCLAAVCLLAAASPALAARAPDLALELAAPSSVFVYADGTYTVTVDNEGTKNADDVTVLIDLPTTQTSPTVHVMGTVGSMSSRCVLSGSQIACDLGRIRKGRSKSVWFRLALPESTEDLMITASADTTTSGESDLSDNDDVVIADLRNYAVVWSPSQAMTMEHCTSRDLSSFFECEGSPSSISSHVATLQVGGTIDLAYPGFTGQWWSDAPDHLAFEYYDATQSTVVSFEGYGVSANCWEGEATFPGNSPWMAMYSVCW